MNLLVTHIEFLLHEHNCVIIPDLGGFVVNTTNSHRDGVALFFPPACELVFNRELTYNDGLLAESYMKTYDLSFEAAMLRIEQEVSEMKKQLREQRSLELGKLGSFTLFDDNRFTYKPGGFVRPAFFGLNLARLKPLIQLQKPVSLTEANRDIRSERQINKTRNLRSASVAAAAVAAVVLIMFFMPMSDRVDDRQSAKISYETEWLHPKSNRLSEVIVENNVSEVVEFPSSEAVDISDDSPGFYIIMGVFKGDKSASRLAESLRADGFSGTDFLKRKDRIDVYAATFNNEADAEDYLRKVHKQFPKYSDAWILKR
ncbi:MAG: SPOR domain-containing protein [Fermentimonas sp.]|nr:SPOR domain-containing protein [Fermentimonas sp.]